MSALTPEVLCPICGTPLMKSRGALACPTCVYREIQGQPPSPPIEEEGEDESE